MKRVDLLSIVAAITATRPGITGAPAAVEAAEDIIYAAECSEYRIDRRRRTDRAPIPPKYMQAAFLKAHSVTLPADKYDDFVHVPQTKKEKP